MGSGGADSATLRRSLAWLVAAVAALLAPTLTGPPHLGLALVTAAVVVALATALSASKKAACLALFIAPARVMERQDFSPLRDNAALDPTHCPLRPRAPELV